MIAQQARFHKISDAFDNMQDRHGQDHPLGGGSLRPGHHRLRSGAFAAGVGRAAHRRPRAHPLHPRSDGRGQRRLACAPAEGDRRQRCPTPLPNRVSGQDSRAQGIISAVSARYPPLGVQIPATQPLATALDYRDKPGTLASKFGIGRAARQCARRCRAQCHQSACRGGRRMTKAPVTQPFAGSSMSSCARPSTIRRLAQKLAQAIAEDFAARARIAASRRRAQAVRCLAVPCHQHSETAWREPHCAASSSRSRPWRT